VILYFWQFLYFSFS